MRVLPVVVKCRKCILSNGIKATLLVNVLRPARRRMWSSGCVELTGENTRFCPCATVHTTLTCNGSESNLALSGEKPATNRLSRDAAFEESNSSELRLTFQFHCLF